MIGSSIMTRAGCLIGKLRKPSLLLLSLVFTAALSAAVTWAVTTVLDDNNETKVFEYVFDGRVDDENLLSVKCWDSGIVGRSDSLKCSGDKHTIYSPCFAHARTKTVKCPNDPSDTSTYHVFKYLPADTPTAPNKENDQHRGYWFIKLSNNDECYFINGATEVVADRRFDYMCSSGKRLFLPIDTSKSPHTISCHENSRLSQCKIKELWG